MTTPPFYNGAWLILQSALEIFTTSANWTALVSATNTRYGTMAIAAPVASAVEVMLRTEDGRRPVQKAPAIRLSVGAARPLLRGVNGPEARMTYPLELRTFTRTTDLPDGTVNAAAAAKGWVDTGAMMRAQLFGQAARWLLENKLIASTVVNPAGGAAIPTGIYNILLLREGEVDHPLPGDPTLLRHTTTLDVHLRTRQGVSRWDAVSA